MNSAAIELVPRQITRWVLVALITAVLFYAVWQVRSTLLLVLGSIILVVLATMPIRFLVRHGMGRMPATFVSLLAIVAAVVVLFMLVLPSLLDQFATLANTVQEGIQQLTTQWEQIKADPVLRDSSPFIARVQDFLITVTGQSDLDRIVNDLTRQLGQAAGQLGGSVLPVVSGVASTLLSLLIVIFLSLYFLAEPQKYEDGVIKLCPISYRHRVRHIINRIDLMLRVWLQGQILLMFIVGIISWFGLALLGLDQALALGVLAGIFSFVPNFGPIAALVPALVVGFVQAPQSIGLIVLIIYGASFLQSQLIAPLIFQESISIPPVLILIGQIFAAVFFGFLGIMLAVPIIAIAMIVVQEVYIKDVLGDKSREEVFLPEDKLAADTV
jgi:predicted PurR-regulated permease PerM